MTRAVLKFEEVFAHRTAVGYCPTCAKRVERNRTFSKRVPAYSETTWSKAKQEVDVLASRWSPSFEHAACRKARGRMTRLAARALVEALPLGTYSRQKTIRDALYRARGAEPPR